MSIVHKQAQCRSPLPSCMHAVEVWISLECATAGRSTACCCCCCCCFASPRGPTHVHVRRCHHNSVSATAYRPGHKSLWPEDCNEIVRKSGYNFAWMFKDWTVIVWRCGLLLPIGAPRRACLLIQQMDGVIDDLAPVMQDRLLQGLQGNITMDAARQRALESILQVHRWTFVL